MMDIMNLTMTDEMMIGALIGVFIGRRLGPQILIFWEKIKEQAHNRAIEKQRETAMELLVDMDNYRKTIRKQGYDLEKYGICYTDAGNKIEQTKHGITFMDQTQKIEQFSMDDNTWLVNDRGFYVGGQKVADLQTSTTMEHPSITFTTPDNLWEVGNKIVLYGDGIPQQERRRSDWKNRGMVQR